MKRAGSLAAFNLIEVVLALGIISFALIAIFGLLSVGLKNNKESSDQIQAANLASFLISTRRGMPTNAIPNFALPSLNLAATNTVTVEIDGLTNTAAGLPGADSYKLRYQIIPGTPSLNMANIYLLLWWPSTLPSPSTNNPGSYYELSTQVPLP